VIAPADIILPALAATDQDTGVVAGRRLARLHVEMIGMHRYFAGNSDAALVRSDFESTGGQTERRGEKAELTPRVSVEETFGVGIVGNAFPEIESGGLCSVHGRVSESGCGASPETCSLSSFRAHPNPGVPLPLVPGWEIPADAASVHESSPASAKKSSIRSEVDLPIMRSAVIRHAIPPNPSGRIFEHSKDAIAVM
jgi:hypothetical protein